MSRIPILHPSLHLLTKLEGGTPVKKAKWWSQPPHPPTPPTPGAFPRLPAPRARGDGGGGGGERWRLGGAHGAHGLPGAPVPPGLRPAPLRAPRLPAGSRMDLEGGGGGARRPSACWFLQGGFLRCGLLSISVSRCELDPGGAVRREAEGGGGRRIGVLLLGALKQ